MKLTDVLTKDTIDRLDAINKIALQLVGIELTELSPAERNIVLVLRDIHVLCLNDGVVAWN